MNRSTRFAFSLVALLFSGATLAQSQDVQTDSITPEGKPAAPVAFVYVQSAKHPSGGEINAFAAVATVNPAEKANLLSASISVAMNCTAFGLMTAVPLLLIHAVLQTKTTELIDSLEMASVKFLNAVTERAPQPTPAAA